MNPDYTHAYRVAIWHRASDDLRADIASRPWPVIDDEGLSQTFRQFLAYDARYQVGGTPDGRWHDESNRSNGIGRICSLYRSGSE